MHDDKTDQFEPAGTFYYFRKAIEIIKLNQQTMAQVARDFSALRFGVAVTAIGGALAFIPGKSLAGVFVGALFSILALFRLCPRVLWILQGERGVFGFHPGCRLERCSRLGGDYSLTRPGHNHMECRYRNRCRAGRLSSQAAPGQPWLFSHLPYSYGWLLFRSSMAPCLFCWIFQTSRNELSFCTRS